MTTRLNALRKAMREAHADVCIVPSADPHASEYVCEHFQLRKYISGFTGSAGTLVVGAGEAALFTDSRYFLQAEQELLYTGIRLMRQGEASCPSIAAYVDTLLPMHGALAVDGRTLSAAQAQTFLPVVSNKQAAFLYDMDLPGKIVEDRPPLPAAPVYLLHKSYTGMPAEKKLEALRAAMRTHGANVHLLSTLDDIAWLFNLRGSDIAYNPLFLAYAVVELHRTVLFVESSRLTQSARAALASLSVQLMPYSEIEAFLLQYGADDCVLLSSRHVNYTLYRLIQERAKIIDAENPTLLFKAVKNPVECENMRRAHLSDGLAHTRFLHWLKTSAVSAGATECSAAQKLDDLRAAHESCIGPSFATISAYGAHAAVVHYTATPETDVPLLGEGLYLVDSGGQYYEGTTDVTRTVALGPTTKAQREAVTWVLKGMLRLSNCVFAAGCCGQHLDAIARQPLWENGLDYLHGTGHGVGSMLCVHEPSASFQWRAPAEVTLMPGMVISCEPGMYVAGAYGIRIENQLLCVPAHETEHGTFLRFETLTLAPIDLDAIEISLLNEQERAWLNTYHARVYSLLAPHLEDDVRQWLQQATREL